MPNHVHLIAVPQSADGLRRAIGPVHRRYTRRVNFREGWLGHLSQGRFASFVLDEPHLLTTARYVELNPVRAELTKVGTNQPRTGMWRIRVLKAFDQQQPVRNLEFRAPVQTSKMGVEILSTRFGGSSQWL